MEYKLASTTVDLSVHHWADRMVGKKEWRLVAMLAFAMVAEMVVQMEQRMVGMTVETMGDTLAALLGVRMAVRWEYWKENAMAETKAAWMAASSVPTWE